MFPLDLKNDRFEAVMVCGVPALFTVERISRVTVPKGLYAYDMQTSEDDWGQPCLLAKHISVEHFGTVLTGTPIDLPENGYRDLTPDDFQWPGPSERPTIQEFAQKHGIALSSPLKPAKAKQQSEPIR